MSESELTPKQEECAAATQSLVIATGGAGVGKTFTALEAAARHLQREGVTAGERVLFVTFSRTAVAQIKARARRLPDEIDARIEIHTFHSLAYRLLRDFGSLAGVGDPAQMVTSVARTRLLGVDGDAITYDSLLERARKILDVPEVGTLVSERWSLVICDEFQDTSDAQAALLERVALKGRLLLLADPNQMIYSFVPGVSSARLKAAEQQADLIVRLEEVSHRDPSGVIPDLAACIRRRDFEAEAIRVAIETGRLTIELDESDTHARVVEIVRELEGVGHREVGVFVTTNAAVVALGALFEDEEVEYSLVGITEAHGEGILAHGMMVAYGLGACSFQDVRKQLAVFITANSRGDVRVPAPIAARSVREVQSDGTGFETDLAQLEVDLAAASSVTELLSVAATALSRLGIREGVAAWNRASVTASAAIKSLGGERGADRKALGERVITRCRALMTDELVGSDVHLGAVVRLMNFHQTKGREADATILAFEPGGHVPGRYDSEPFSEASRVLYVALSRARSHVRVVLPPGPHAFIAPFATAGSARAVIDARLPSRDGPSRPI